MLPNVRCKPPPPQLWLAPMCLTYHQITRAWHLPFHVPSSGSCRAMRSPFSLFSSKLNKPKVLSYSSLDIPANLWGLLVTDSGPQEVYQEIRWELCSFLLSFPPLQHQRLPSVITKLNGCLKSLNTTVILPTFAPLDADLPKAGLVNQRISE